MRRTSEEKQLYGVTRNVRGLHEIRYLYTKAQLARHLAGFKAGSPKRYWDSFRADDTFVAEKLESDAEVLSFVKGEKNRECDFDNPTLLDLSEWYSEFAEDDMFTGKTNPTASGYLGRHGLSAENLDVCDWRYEELLRNGIPLNCFEDREYASTHRYHETDKSA